MRIAFICSANNPHVIARMKYLSGAGHDVFYYGILSSSDLAKNETSCNVPEGAEYIPIMPKGFLKIFKAVYVLLQLRKLTRRDNVDIVHIMWLGHVLYTPFLKKRKTVFEIMGSDILVHPEKSWLWRVYIQLFFRFSDAVIQDSLVSQAKGLKYGAPEENNEVIEVGVDFKHFHRDVSKGVARKSLGIRDEQKFVLSPRSFAPVYNIDIVFRSIQYVAKVYPDIRFVFCKFSGEIDDKMLQILRDTNTEQFAIFAGRLDGETELPFYFRDADAVVSVPSSDSSPRSINEAIACMAPVIVSDLPWFKGKFEANQDVYVVPVRDEKALAEAIIKILDNGFKLDLEGAYQKVLQNINQDKANKKLENLYFRLLGS